MPSILKNIILFPLTSGHSRHAHQSYKDGSISSAVMLTSVISVSFVLIVIFTSLKPDENINPSPVLWVLTFVMITGGLFFTIALSISGYRNREEYFTPENTIMDWSGSRKLAFLWIFGFGTVMHSVMNATINIDCLGTSGKESFKGEFILSIISHVLVILFYTLLIGFISYFHRYRFESSNLVNYGMLSILGATLVQWFHTVFLEYSVSTNGSPSNSTMHSDDCYWNSTLIEFFRKIYPYIIPAQIECGLLTTAFILGMWTTARRGIGITQNANLESLAEVASLIHTTSNSAYQSISIPRRQDSVHDVTSLSHYVFLVIGIALSIPFLTCVSIYNYVMDEDSAMFYIWEVIECIYKIILFLVVLSAFHALETQCYEVDNARGIQSSEGILIISMAGVVGFNCFGIVAGSMTGSDEKRHLPLVWIVMENMMNIISSFLQTVLIIQAERYKRLRQNNRSCLKIEDLFLLLHISNFTLWLTDSITANQILHTTQVQKEFFGHGDWTLITHIVFPIVVFYRFHSTIHCYGLYKKLQI